MSTPASSGDGLEVVVGKDGTLTVPAAELARHGWRPGSHLRIVVDVHDQADIVEEQVQVEYRSSGGPKRKSVRGSLAHLVTPEDVDAFVDAMGEAQAERIAHVDPS